MTTQERMLKRLRELLEPEGITLPEDTELHSTHAGAVQRADGAWSWFAHSGAWSWFAHTQDGAHLAAQVDVGSHYPMTVLLRCKSLSVDHTEFVVHIDPCESCVIRYGHTRL